jgi:hypothetical protein
VLGFAAFAGGMWMRRTGPRPVAIAADILYGLGIALAGLSHNVTMLYLTYGVIGARVWDWGISFRSPPWCGGFRTGEG